MKLSKGTRGRLYAVWVCSLVVALPAVIGAAIILGTQMGPVFKLIKSFQIEPAVAQLKPIGLMLLADVAVLLLPLIPLRHLMIAACIHTGEQAKEQ